MATRTRCQVLAVLFVFTVATLMLTTPAAAGAASQPERQAAWAIADLVGTGGESVGTAIFTQTPAGVQITIRATGLPPGEHGLHLHEVGACDPPDFTTAGAHFNPGHNQHGLRNPLGPHAGDLPNLRVGGDGTATATITTDRVTLDQGETSLFDADGSALVVHAMADDQLSDPAGNSGGRIACGIITPIR